VVAPGLGAGRSLLEEVCCLGGVCFVLPPPPALHPLTRPLHPTPPAPRAVASADEAPADTPHSVALDSGVRAALAGGAPDAREFFTALGVCNTVVPTVTEQGQLLYQVRGGVGGVRSGAAWGVCLVWWLGPVAAVCSAAVPAATERGQLLYQVA
jgi:hypothetical protein